MGELWIHLKCDGVAASAGGQAWLLIGWVNFWIMGELSNHWWTFKLGWTSDLQWAFKLLVKFLNMSENLDYGGIF